MSRSSRETPEVDILHWLQLRPNKLGSIEDYVIQLTEAAAERQVRSAFVFEHGTSEVVRRTMRERGVVAYFVDEIASLARFREFVTRLNPWGVHFHFFSQCQPLYFGAHSLLRRATIVTAHLSTDEDDETRESGVLGVARRVRRRLYATQVDRFLAVSGFVAGQLAGKGAVAPAKISLVYNGIDMRRHYVRAPSERAQLKQRVLGVEPGCPVITFVGQIEEYKGINDLLEAIPQVAARAPDVRFVFVGTGTLDDAPGMDHPAIMRLGLRDDVQDILGASDIFWAPSRWHEAFGLVIVEASAAGLPVISTNVGAIPEVIQDGVHGYLVAPGDPAALVARAFELLGDADLRQRMGTAGRERAVRQFSLDDSIAATLDVYEALRAKRPRLSRGR